MHISPIFVDRVRANVSEDIRQLGHDRSDMIDPRTKKKRTKISFYRSLRSAHTISSATGKEILSKWDPTAGRGITSRDGPGGRISLGSR